ncbi:Uncharacterized protein BP5553_02409 [Venustampulla echinocandica]|uniref:Acetylserotonin methytransferase-like protein n=1 Tax=Venustampulla echinocandica TaxID=2656787 RepID=A0A370U3S2_9HELO|nr:Uncharacterized protein BP5553_02409 [Venustampulla echinocandica]RDL42430.1 Uncharacterized protein BP5553_02409 [Venustampulla echinocandica]
MTTGAGSSSGQPANVGLQLFPPPPKKRNPSRKPSTRRHAVTPQSPPQSAVERPESPASIADGRQSALGGRQTPQPPAGAATTSYITPPSQAHLAAEIPRSHTSLSEAPTLVRSGSISSQNSIAKTGLNSSPPREEPVMRSIFPRYNPDVPLEYQPYFPTQASPTHIPKTVINRRPYSPSIQPRSPPGLHSPMSVGSSAGHFPQGVQDETILEPSSTDELKELWKVANGWRVSSSEGRTFCLKMNSAAEEPVHTLSSATQPFYTLRIIPTSTSAQLTMTRQDPNKSPSSTPLIGSTLSRSKDKEKDSEVLSTTLEEAARRLPPNDGLVALLYPRAASSMALDVVTKPHRADAASVIAAAERECARLVWDVDSQKYYLVHPALSNPFVVSIASSPAWSRIEYTLEHPELPRNLVRLVRDGSGSGYLEVDTSAAARIDAFYVVDVAICAIMLVAVEEEKGRNIERFDAPPPNVDTLSPASPLSPLSSPRKAKKEKKRAKENKKEKKSPKMEEFEIDLESQGSFKKGGKDDDKVPGCCGLIWMLIKCFVWSFVLVIKGGVKVLGWVGKKIFTKS